MTDSKLLILYPQYIIFYLFIIKFLFFLICTNRNKNNFLLRYSDIIYRGTIVSLLLLFIYLIIIRLLLGWELRWLTPIYLLFFFTGIFLDAFYFGIIKHTSNNFYFNKNYSNNFEKLIQKKYFVVSYRLIKRSYYYISILYYAYSGIFSLFTLPIPTVDSVHSYRTFFCDGGDKQSFSKYWNQYYPVQSINDFKFSECVVWNKVILSNDNIYQIIYEKKAIIFRKHIISFREMDVCFFINNSPSSCDCNEFSDDNELRNLSKKNKLFFKRFKDDDSFKYTENYPVFYHHYNMDHLNERQSIRVKLNAATIEIEAFCGSTTKSSTNKEEINERKFLIHKIKII